MDEKMLRKAGYVPLSEFDDSGRRSNDGHAPRYKTLKKAIDKGEKSIPSAQIPGVRYGRYWVHKDSAERFLSEAEEPASSASAQAAAEQSRSASRLQSVTCSTERTSVDDAIHVLHEIKSGISLIGETLRDLCAAVQLLAEQQARQNEPANSWRDMNSDVMN